MPQHDPYFAALPEDQIGLEIMARVRSYYTNPRVLVMMAKQRLAYRYYYDLGLTWAGWGDLGSTSSMTRGGDQGELALIRINHCRSLVRNLIAMISNAKFDRKPRAARYDYASMEAAKRAASVLEHYGRERLESHRVQSIESASVLGEGFTHYEWDPHMGREAFADPMTKLPVRTGDVAARDVLPWDVIRDPWREWGKLDWVAVRIPRWNKYDLVARFGRDEETADKIMNAPRTSIPFFVPTSDAGQTLWAPDDIEVFRFYHRPSATLPRGRDVTLLADGTVLAFHDLLWDVFPLSRRVESNVMGSSYGYPSFWEYLGIQELYDSLQSVVATNQSTFGNQLVGVKKGVDPTPIQMGGGLAVIPVDEKDDVFPIQLTKSPPEIFGHMEGLRRNMELLANQSSVNRGEAQGDRQSGAALALLSAETIRNASPYQTSDVEALRYEAKLVLRMLREMAKRKMTIGIRSSGSSPYDMEFTGKDLGDSDNVDIELASPLQQTTEGRIAMLTTFAQLKIPLKPEQAEQVIMTGRMEPATDNATQEGLRILRENELIAQGRTPIVLISDDHVRHCTEHKNVVMDPDALETPGVVEAFVAHIHQHYERWYGQNPNNDPLYRIRVMVLCGVQPPPPGPEDMMQPPMPAPGGAPGPQPGQSPALPPGNPDAGVPSGLPGMPTNKATGQEWNPVTGGGTPHPVVQK